MWYLWALTSVSGCHTSVEAPQAHARRHSGHREDSHAHHSLLRLREVLQVRWFLPLFRRHQGAVRADEIELLADGDVAGAFQAREPAPVRILLAAAPVGLVDGPGSRQGAVEHRDYFVQDCEIVLVVQYPLIEL